MTSLLSNTLSVQPDSSRQRRRSLINIFTSNPDNILNANSSDVKLSVKEQDRIETLQKFLDQCSITDTLTSSNCSSQYFESSWQDIVFGHKRMSKTERDEQEAIWELIRTEYDYITKLAVVSDVYINTLDELHCASQLKEINSPKLFSNIRQLFWDHLELWKNFFNPVLERSRESKCPLSISHQYNGSTISSFFQAESKLQSYSTYCIEEGACLDYAKKMYKSNSIFKSFVNWCETQKVCERLKLADLLVKPMQRLTKYPLLLKAVLRNTRNLTAIQIISENVNDAEQFVGKINATLRHYFESEKLSSVLNRIQGYDVIDPFTDEHSKILKQYNSLELSSPMPGCSERCFRKLLFEGPMRIKDQSGKENVYTFLFTDMLLFTKPLKKGDKVKIIKPPLLIANIRCHSLKDPETFLLAYLNEFKVVTSVFMVTLASNLLTNSWLNNIELAKRSYHTAIRQSRSTSFEDEQDEVSDEFNQVYKTSIGVFKRRDSAPVLFTSDAKNADLGRASPYRTSSASQNPQSTPMRVSSFSPAGINPSNPTNPRVLDDIVFTNPSNSLRQEEIRKETGMLTEGEKEIIQIPYHAFQNDQNSQKNGIDKCLAISILVDSSSETA